MKKNFSEVKKVCSFAMTLAICSTAFICEADLEAISALSEQTYNGYSYEQITSMLSESDYVAEFSVEKKNITLDEAENEVTVEFRLDNDTYINEALFDFIYDANDMILVNIEVGDGVYGDDFGHHNVTAKFPINVDYSSEHPGASGQLVKLTFKIRDPQAGDRYVINASNSGEIYQIASNGAKNEMIPAYDYGYIAIEDDVASTEVTTEVTTIATTTTTEFTTTTTEATTTTEITTTTTENVPSEKEFIWNEDNWNFTNSHDYFGYGVYNIKKEYLDILLAQSTNTEKEEILDLQQSKWGGSCYGMAVTSALSKTPVFNVPKWYPGAKCVHDLPSPDKNSDVESLINYYFLTQVTDDIWQERCITDYEPEITKIQRMKEYFASHKQPALFCFCCPWWGGHAVVAYDDVEETGQISGFKYTGYFKIYDNNCSKYNEEFNFYYDDDGDWIIPYYGINSYYYGAYISLFTADKSLMNTHGYFDENGNVKSVNGNTGNTYTNFIASMTSNTKEANFNITKIMDSGDFGAAGNEIDDDEIRISHSMFETGNVSKVDILLKDSSSGYRYEVSDGNPTELELSMRYENSLFKASSDKGTAVDFLPDGKVFVESEGGKFDIRETFNEGHYSLPWYTVNVSGSGSDSAELTKTEDGFILESDNLSDIAVKANNDTVVVGAGFSTECNRIFIYAVDNNSIGIKADTDNDGTFETEIKTAEYKAGDATSDGEIDIRDITALNQYIVGISSFKNIQLMNADVISDGTVDVKDLGQLKKYIVKLIDKF